MFGFKEPTHTIAVVDDRTSLVDAKLAEHERVLNSFDLRHEARQKNTGSASTRDQWDQRRRAGSRRT